MEKKRTQIQSNKKPKSFPKGLVWLISIVVLLAAGFAAITLTLEQAIVYGNSMAPGLSEGQRLLVNKAAYVFSDPQRFDVVVFEGSAAHPEEYVKRIIGLPGEQVEIKDGLIYIDGQRLTESYGLEIIYDTQGIENIFNVPEDSYFVLGDNRNHSEDSRNRSIGYIQRESIRGRAFFCLWPIGMIH